jgi:hypothetical protein
MYYLLNHTRKEFCSFDTKIPVFELLAMIIKLYPTWNTTDDIKVDSEYTSDSPLLFIHLIKDLKYKDLDHQTPEYMSDFKSSKYLELDNYEIDYHEYFTPILDSDVFTKNPSEEYIVLNIFFENDNGFQVRMLVDGTIKNIKDIIQDMHHIDINKQRLIYKNSNGSNGVSLKDDNQILDYNFLRDGTNLYLFILE